MEPAEPINSQATPKLRTLTAPSASIKSRIPMTKLVENVSGPVTASDLLAPAPTGETILAQQPPTRFRTVESLHAYAEGNFIHSPNPTPYREQLITVMSRKKNPASKDLSLFVEKINQRIPESNKNKEMFRCVFCDDPGTSGKQYPRSEAATKHVKQHHTQYFTFPCVKKLCGNTEW